MKSFNRATLPAWVKAHRTVAALPPRTYSSAEAITLSLSLIEAAWPRADDALNRRLREEDAAPVRRLWVALARRTGRLG